MAVREDQHPAGRISNAAFAALLLVAGCGEQQGAPRIVVEDSWARETAPRQAAAAVYLTVANNGDAADRLLDVSSPGAAAASLHSSSISDGVARMRPIDDGVEIPARSRVELKPGGTHIMVTGLSKPLQAGETLDLSMEFERSGPRPVSVRVMPATATEGHSQHRTGT